MNDTLDSMKFYSVMKVDIVLRFGPFPVVPVTNCFKKKYAF